MGSNPILPYWPEAAVCQVYIKERRARPSSPASFFLTTHLLPAFFLLLFLESMWKYGSANQLNFFQNMHPAVTMTFAVLVFFDLVLKGISLWRSARSGQSYWFIALFVVNSLGILPLIYLAFFAKSPKKSSKK